MAVRNNKLSLEEVGGFLVDINRPAGPNVVVRGGTLVLNDQILNYSDTVVNFTLSGMSGSLYYKILIFINTTSGSVLASNAGGPGQPSVQDAIDNISITIEPYQIPLAFVIVEATGATTINNVESSTQIVDLRSTVNVTRNIEQIYTTEASPENLVIVANADGSLTATSTLDGLTRVEVVGTADANFADYPPSDSGASITTEGGVSIDQKLHVRGDVRVDSTSLAGDNLGSSGALQVKGGVSIGGGSGASSNKDLEKFLASGAPADVKVLGDGFFGGNVKSKAAFLEEGLITIGDGVTTFGHFNAVGGVLNDTDDSAIDKAMTKALSMLGSKPKIRIKAGSYTTDGPISLGDITLGGISVEGEGVGTVITFSSTSDFIGLGWDNVEISNLTLVSPSGGTAIKDNKVGGVVGCIIDKVRFSGSGATDIEDPSPSKPPLHLNNIFTNCISTTTTTNLP